MVAFGQKRSLERLAYLKFLHRFISCLACGTDAIRRVLTGYSAMIAMADPRRPDGAAIRPFCEAGERL